MYTQKFCFSELQSASLLLDILIQQILLDAAAFVPHSRLDLSELAVDFVAMSFSKLFGFNLFSLNTPFHL